MISYNVTVNVEDEIREEWLNWMKSTHLPEVMATGMFLSHQMFRLITMQVDETGTTYVIQYFLESMDHYNRYQKEFAPALQAQTRKAFGEKFTAFRSVMEQV